MRPPFLLIPDKILQKNQITEPGSLADLLPALMGNAVRVQSAVQMARSQMRMENLKAMHIKRFVAHLLTFRHTVYYRIWSFCRPFRRTGREHHKTSDKPPPAGVGSRDGLLYVYHTADCSPLWCVVGCVVLYRTRRRPLVRCRSPPNVQDFQKFLNIWRTRPCGIEIMDK